MVVSLLKHYGRDVFRRRSDIRFLYINICVYLYLCTAHV